MDELEKKQMERCLACKIGHAVIEGYANIYKFFFEEPRMKSTKEDVNGTISELAELLNMKGTFKENRQRLQALSQFERTNDEILREKNCFTLLQPIIAFLTPFFIDQLDGQIAKKPYAKIIYSKMHALNIKYADEYDKYIGEDVVNRLYVKEYAKGNYDSYMTDGLKEIYSKYIEADIKGEKCNLDSINFLNVADKLSQEYRENLKEQAMQNEFSSLCSRIGRLSSQYQAIMWDYIKYAPKKFCNILKAVMELQGMNETDVARLLYIKPNRIQAFQKNVELPKDKDMVTLLSRALLVSEDVLSCGYGQIYGNWNGLFRKEEIRYIKNSTELNLSNTTEAKKWLKKNIRELMEMKQEEFEEFVKENSPAFFYTEEISVFGDTKDSYEELLDKKAVYTLLGVLERMDKRQR